MQIGKKDRKILKESDQRVIKNSILESLYGRQSPPHALIELSKVEHKRIKYNCIHLSDSYKDSKSQNLNYKTIHVGSNIHLKRMSVPSEIGTVITDELVVSRIKRNTVLITMNKNEAQAIHKGLIVTQSRHNMDPSGIVVLFISIYNPIKSHRRLWIDDDKRRLEKCKPNITVSFSHYGSSGYVASFGNKGSFDKAAVSSVGQYSTKKSKN